MKVLAVAPRTGSFPIGLSYVVSAMRRAGHDVDCVNLDLEPGYAIPKDRYDVVATGGLACHFQDVRRIAAEARSAGSKIVVGGGLVSADLEFMRRQVQADTYVVGEGEHVILDILERVRSGAPLPEVVKGPSIADLDSLPYPDYEAFGYAGLLDRARASDAFFTDVFDHPRVYPIIASRSCPFRCTFCYSPLGTKYRQRSVRSVLDELREVIPRHRINIVQVMDELFSYDESRVREFCYGLKQIAATVPWEIAWGCSLRVDGLEESMLDLLKEADCTFIQYGFESYSPTVLRSMKKHIKPEQIHRAVHLTLDRKISVQANFIFGDVAETAETAEETLAFWREHADAGIQLFHVLPLPDSEIYRSCLQRGIIPDKLEYYERGLFNVRNMTALSDGDFLRLVGKVTLAAIRHTPTAVPEAVSRDGMVVTCPCCGVRSEYRNYAVESGCSYPSLFPVKPSRRFFYKNVYCRECRKMFMVASWAARLWFRFVALAYTPRLAHVYRWLVELKRKGTPRIKEWSY